MIHELRWRDDEGSGEKSQTVTVDMDSFLDHVCYRILSDILFFIFIIKR